MVIWGTMGVMSWDLRTGFGCSILRVDSATPKSNIWSCPLIDYLNLKSLLFSPQINSRFRLLYMISRFYLEKDIICIICTICVRHTSRHSMWMKTLPKMRRVYIDCSYPTFGLVFDIKWKPVIERKVLTSLFHVTSKYFEVRSNKKTGRKSYANRRH